MEKSTQNTDTPNALKNHTSSLLILILIAACICIIAHTYFGYSTMGIFSGHAFGSDDAYISYRYAENLIKGNGLVFNPGERVEGYSNFLYVLLMTPGAYYGNDFIYLYSVGINSILLVLSIIIFYKILRTNLSEKYSIIGTALLALNPAIWANTATGLETTLVLLTFFLTWLIVESPRTKRNITWLIIVSTLSILARVDGFIFPLIAAFYLFLKNENKIAISLTAYIFILMIVYALFRYNYYHDIISNTYYAKITGNIAERIVTGIRFLALNTALNGIALYFVFSALSLIMPYPRRKELYISFPLTFFVIWTAYIIYIGGDIYYERFLLPLLAIGIYFFITHLHVFTSKRLELFVTAFLLAASFLVFPFDSRFYYQRKTYDMWVNLGKFLQQAPDDYLLAIDAAGKVPYYSKLKTLDMLGLNNKTIGKMDGSHRQFRIGHTKFDTNYTLSKNPHLIATWMDKDFDMLYSLTRERYEKNYTIKYLINASRHDMGCNILDAENLTKPAISSILSEGVYYYAVIARNDIIDTLPDINTECKISTFRENEHVLNMQYSHS